MQESNKLKYYTVVGLGVLVPIVMMSLLVLNIASAFNIETKEVTVVSKERLLKVSSEGESKYENFVTVEDDIYTVRDSLFKWEWYSLKTYANVKVGKCTLKLQGYRIGILSMKKNILKAECMGGDNE